MSLEAKINEELKLAVKSRDKIRLETLRSIRAGIIEFKKSGIDRDMNEDDEMKILKTNAKRRRDAIDLYVKGNRPELADKEKAELKVIEEFLPEQMGEEQLAVVINNIVDASGASGMQDMGKVMGMAMKELKGKADGTAVKNIVQNILGSK